MKLSLCIPCYNEEKNIHYPLDSAYDLVDEVVIVDGGSTDKTINIARSYGNKVKIYQTDNPRNFLFNKQKAIEVAQGDWILQLDADEAISEELKKEIKNVINDKNQPFVGFWLPRKNWFLNRFLMKGGVYPDYVLRLYKRKAAKFELKHLHENVIVNGKIGYLKNPILHYADPDFSRYLLRWDRYTTFDAQELAKKIKTRSLFKTLLLGIDYFIIKPTMWFLKTYFRHKGFIDGFPGFVFSLFSSIRYWVIYIKWWQMNFSEKS